MTRKHARALQWEMNDIYIAEVYKIVEGI
jgi:hypothetical protein